MKNIKFCVYLILNFFIIISCSAKNKQLFSENLDSKSKGYNLVELETRLKSFISTKNCKIGVAVIVNSRDTVSVNGEIPFQMMSVFKFPLSLAIADRIDANGYLLKDSIEISAEELLEDTYSPMLGKYGKRNLRLPVAEIMDWALTQSDNNAADILLKRIGGVERLTSIMKILDFPENIKVGATEADMHRDQKLSNLNTSTPLAMAELFDQFNVKMRNRSESFRTIASLIEQCKTGTDRLAVPFIHTCDTLGHKTGTGFDTDEGGLSALNDCGYVNLANGGHYSIAVLIEDTPADMKESSKIIAEISQMVYDVVGN
ncbi:MAG: class A beta-lactamase-related serine hydrolase [Muribaculaceae bacterium]|nr:class A beta-lactamase-related serine hydrolase [Muribaculaceae bacterium]